MCARIALERETHPSLAGRVRFSIPSIVAHTRVAILASLTEPVEWGGGGQCQKRGIMRKDVRESALTILRVLEEYGEGSLLSLDCNQLLALTGLDERSFDQADTFLLQGGFIEGTMGGMDGSRWMNVAGALYIDAELRTRLPLSLDAERLLNYMFEHRETSNWGSQNLKERLGFSDERYHDACRALDTFGLLRNYVHQGEWRVIGIAKEGERAVYDRFRLPNTSTPSVIFDQRGQNVTYQYNAAGDINIGAVQNKADFVDQLEKLKAEVSKAAESEVIDADLATEAKYEIERAVNQVKKPQPNKQTVSERLEGAAKLLQGATAATGLVDALIKAAEHLRGLNLF